MLAKCENISQIYVKVPAFGKAESWRAAAAAVEQFSYEMSSSQKDTVQENRRKQKYSLDECHFAQQKEKILGKSVADKSGSKWHKSSAASHLRSMHPKMVRLLEETIEPEMPSEMEKLQDQTLYMMRFNCRRQKGNLWLEGYNASVCFCSGDEIRVENTFKHVPQPPSQNVIPSTPLSDPSNATSSNERY